ncbi:unnamed protein product [Prorocentrum cordatum]|uniref:Cilia- and flagella-associated protein 206 n=1 Tax=Prorocentrum cordatum TaxID=2364126 RepID=A0ABN9UCE7_9DINO|nr:unnamed protein product [Polarella glacialis]
MTMPQLGVHPLGQASPETLPEEVDAASTGQVLKAEVAAGGSDTERTAQLGSGPLSHGGAGKDDPDQTMATELSTTVGSVPEAAIPGAAEPPEPELPGESSTTLVSVAEAARLAEEPAPAEEEPAQSSADVLSGLVERAEDGDQDVMLQLVRQILVIHKQTGIHCTVFAASCAEQWTQLTDVRAVIKRGQEAMEKGSKEAMVCKCLAQAVAQAACLATLAPREVGEKKGQGQQCGAEKESEGTGPGDPDAGGVGEARPDEGEEGEESEDGEHKELLRTLSAANEGGAAGDFEAHIAEIVRLSSEFGDRPKDVADALVNEWTGDLREKVKTLKSLAFDKESQKEQHTVRKVLVGVLQDRLLEQETKEYHEALAREKADALASTAGRRKAAGAALSAVRQKRLGASS